jgi:hypothetical protein
MSCPHQGRGNGALSIALFVLMNVSMIVLVDTIPRGAISHEVAVSDVMLTLNTNVTNVTIVQTHEVIYGSIRDVITVTTRILYIVDKRIRDSQGVRFYAFSQRTLNSSDGPGNRTLKVFY